MCGIVGAAARRDIVPVLVEGLRRLEYRGYDSCGVAIVEKEIIGRVVSVARVEDLAAQVDRKHIRGKTGLAHTRWATHGAPAAENAHPILSRGEIALVHNGIIENHDELRAELAGRGYRFEGQTDTEVVAHLVHSLYGGDLLEAVRNAVKRLTGAYAIAVVARGEPGRVVGARDGMPLLVGVGENECFLASDALALAGTTDRIAYLEDGDVAAIADNGWQVFDRSGRPAAREVRVVKASGAAAELGP
jgi:glutamine---fructose-6-phosphate transaminase (isomerizing)